MLFPCDYHTHNHRCGHATDEIEAYVQAAIAANLTEFGAADHAPTYFLEGDDPLPTTTMAKSEMNGYVAEIAALREKYADSITLKIGIEADFVRGFETIYRSELAAQPFDYVLGSVHWIADDSNIMNPKFWEMVSPTEAQEIYALYYRLVIESAQSGIFDILSHPTAVEAYGAPIEPRLAEEWYPQVAAAIAESGSAIEINTSGFRKMRTPNNADGMEPFPNRKMLRLLVERGVPITFGSDAHRPADVAYGREKVASVLHDLGVDKMPEPISVYRNSFLAIRP